MIGTAFSLRANQSSPVELQAYRSCSCCRLDNLRKIVPHSERANTAAFLEEVYNYVEAMQKRVLELEQAQKAKLVQVGAPVKTSLTKKMLLI